MPTARLIGGSLHARLHDPDGAVAAGFLDEAVDAAELADMAMARARELASLPNPAYAISKANLVRPVRELILGSLDADVGGT